MASIEKSPESVPIPALLIERATALARAEAGMVLVHARRITVAAVSALLGTIAACAFAQLAIVLLVAWPVLASKVPHSNLLLGVVVSALVSAGAASFAIITWLGVARERRNGAAREPGASHPPASSASEHETAVRVRAASGGPGAVTLAERVSP